MFSGGKGDVYGISKNPFGRRRVAKNALEVGKRLEERTLYSRRDR